MNNSLCLQSCRFLTIGGAQNLVLLKCSKEGKQKQLMIAESLRLYIHIHPCLCICCLLVFVC
jgi:hypothetical protein